MSGEQGAALGLAISQRFIAIRLCVALYFKEGIKMYDPRQWSFVTDMNYSGSVTISDVWLWVKWLYFYPGDGLIYFLVNNVPKIGQFFEITYSSYGGIFSGVVSFVVWIIALAVIWNLFNEEI